MSFLGVTDSQKNQLQFSVLIVGAVGLTVGLAWSNAINSLINTYFPETSSLSNAWYKLAYAAVLTVVVGVIMKLL